MDRVYRFNKERWEALAKANALFSRPWLSETKESALRRLDHRDYSAACKARTFFVSREAADSRP
jgi:hypothetical protein